MLLVEIVCTNCGTINYAHDDGMSVYPDHCHDCKTKLPIPKESEEKVVDYGIH